MFWTVSPHSLWSCKVFRYDSTRGVNPRSTDCEADALTTTPSRRSYIELVSDMLNSFKDLGCNISIKVHSLNSHLDHFSKRLGDLSEEQGERFHQDITVMQEKSRKMGCHGAG